MIFIGPANCNQLWGWGPGFAVLRSEGGPISEISPVKYLSAKFQKLPLAAHPSPLRCRTQVHSQIFASTVSFLLFLFPCSSLNYLFAGLAFIAYWGIVLFGYDTYVLGVSVISLDLPFISGIAGGVVSQANFQKHFGMWPNGVENKAQVTAVSSNVVSVLQAGAFFGALGSAPISGMGLTPSPLPNSPLNCVLRQVWTKMDSCWLHLYFCYRRSKY